MMRVTDLEKFALEEIWRPYQTMKGYERRLEKLPMSLDDTAKELVRDATGWSNLVFSRLRGIGVRFPAYVQHALVDAVRTGTGNAPPVSLGLAVTEGDSSRDAQSLPTGAGEGEWLLVPVEPTEAMLNAARENDAELREQGFNGAEVEGVWATMLAHSPSPDTVVVGRERETIKRIVRESVRVDYKGRLDPSSPGEVADRILALSSLPVEGGE